MEKKQVLLIYGSPKPDGDVARLVAACLAGMGEVTLTRYDCFAAPPLPCDDCGYCHRAAGCQKRDLDGVYEALEAAEVLIFAAPVYNRGFPAPMKAFLDRLQRYWAARFVRGERPPIKTPKKTVLLTAGGSGRGDGTYLSAQLAPTLTVLNSAPALSVHADATDRTGITEETLAAAREAGRAAVI